MPNKEQEYKEHIKELEQQIRLLKEQVDFLTRKLYGTKSEKTSTLEIEGQMSLFNEIETMERAACCHGTRTAEELPGLLPAYDPRELHLQLAPQGDELHDAARTELRHPLRPLCQRA